MPIGFSPVGIFVIIIAMIYHKRLFNEIVVLSVIVAAMHHYATINFLYWSIKWFDIPMHFLGGLLMGFIGLFIFFTFEKIHFPKNNRLLIFCIAVGFTLIVGLGWELWEIFTGLTDVLKDLGDTLLDLVLDTAGAIVSYLYNIKKIWEKN